MRQAGVKKQKTKPKKYFISFSGEKLQRMQPIVVSKLKYKDYKMHKII